MLDYRVNGPIAAVALDLFVVQRIAEAVEGDVPVLAGRGTMQTIKAQEPDQRSPDAAMAASLACGAAGLDHLERAVEITIQLVLEAFFFERPGQSTFTAARDRGHHGRPAIRSDSGGQRQHSRIGGIARRRAGDGFGVSCRFCRLSRALRFAATVCRHDTATRSWLELAIGGFA